LTKTEKEVRGEKQEKRRTMEESGKSNEKRERKTDVKYSDAEK
jgi:hypothetical protein